MRKLKSAAQAQRFLSDHGVTLDLFRVGRNLLRPANQRTLRARSFLVWSEVKMALFDFIEGWYDPQRRHSSIAYMSPLAFERSREAA